MAFQVLFSIMACAPALVFLIILFIDTVSAIEVLIPALMFPIFIRVVFIQLAFNFLSKDSLVRLRLALKIKEMKAI